MLQEGAVDLERRCLVDRVDFLVQGQCAALTNQCRAQYLLASISAQIGPIDDDQGLCSAVQQAPCHGCVDQRSITGQLEVSQESIAVLDAMAQSKVVTQYAAHAHQTQAAFARGIGYGCHAGTALGMSGRAFGVEQILYDGLCMHGLSFAVWSPRMKGGT
jgi:hypothetical protein